MKKLFSALVTLMAVFTFSISAFADEVDTIPPPDLGTADSTEVHSEAPAKTCYINEIGQKTCEDVNYSAGWDYSGSDYVYLTTWTYNGWDAQYTRNIGSTGGGFKITILGQSGIQAPSGTSPLMQVDLWEDDGTYGDDHIRTWYIDPKSYNQSVSISNASDYKDGIDNDAEFYLVVHANYKVSGDKGWFYFYD
jgi:hypothetical protein